MAHSTALARVPGLRVLLLSATVCCALLFGVGADPAAANHLTYCGHTHSGGSAHGSRPGDYWWSHFIGQTDLKDLGQWYHDRRGNHYRGDYWKLCDIGTPV